MIRPEDPIELLLPEAGDAERARARRLTTALRLLVDDARPARAETVGVDLDRARVELDAEAQRRLSTALTRLLAHHLDAAVGADGFLGCGAAPFEHQEGWDVVAAFRPEHPWLATVPAPGEPPADVAARLLAGLASLAERVESEGRSEGVLRPRYELDLLVWKARLCRVRAGPREGEAAFRAQLEALTSPRRRRGATEGVGGARDALLAGLVECLLDRGAVREARAELEERLAPRTRGDRAVRTARVAPRVLLLASWTRLLTGDVEAAGHALAGLSRQAVAQASLPAALVELRERRVAWLPYLTGRARSPGSSPVSSSLGRGRALGRSDLGAAVLAWFSFQGGPAGVARPVRVEAAPALDARSKDWAEDRADACRVPGGREHRALVYAERCIEHREPDATLRGLLGRSSVAVCVAPLTDDEGRAIGWMHLELEHHLVPSAATLDALERHGREVVLVADRAYGSDGEPAAVAVPTSTGRADATGAAQRVFERFVEGLGFKTAQRRWWGLVVRGARRAVVASGGGGEGLAGAADGRALALERAAAAAGGCVWQEARPGLALHRDAASGVVVPLRPPAPGSWPRDDGGVPLPVEGWLVVESRRRRDFREGDLARWTEVGERCGLALWLARFRAQHREVFGLDVHLDVDAPGFAEFVAHLIALARSPAPLALSGEAGVGATVFSRLACFAAGQPLRELRSETCRPRTTSRDLARWLTHRDVTPFVLERVDELDADLQLELLQDLERAPGGRVADRASTGRAHRTAALIVTSREAAEADAGGRATGSPSPPGPPSRPGLLRADLARRLDRRRLHVPALRARRSGLAALIHFVVCRSAADERVDPPVLSDGTLGLLWRQPWRGNLRELEALVEKLVLLHPGRVVEPGDVQALARRFGTELLDRLPSRHPAPSDLVAALRSTRTVGGRPNKTRAAAWLGWDPDTLCARLADAGIDAVEAAGAGADEWLPRVRPER